MVDYTDSKKASQGNYPVEIKESSGLISRIETIITPDLLKSRYLKGVDLSDYNDEELKDEINLAINEIELLSGLTITPEQFSEVLPFDANLYKSHVYVKTNHGPIQSVESFVIESSDENLIYPLPVKWLDLRLGHRRQINIIPLLTAGVTGANSNVSTAGAYLFVNSLNGTPWMPAFWKITYTSGICKDGKIPSIFNQVIGMTTAMELLSIKQAQFKHTSQSLGQDGISQASSGHGNQQYQVRIEELEKKRDKLLSKARSVFFSKYFITDI